MVPLEPATMPGRVVVQWDKEDCADLGIIKVDLLGLGMMSALQDSPPPARRAGASRWTSRTCRPDDPKVYAMLQKADTVGLFQVESRAQMATLPRMKPDHFYDLVVEVAIIRPGPIVGKMVHPYLRRRNGQEPVKYAHPSLEPILKRTLGVPLFQEQLLRMAMTVAGFTGGEAEELRRAMGFKRSREAHGATSRGGCAQGMQRAGDRGGDQPTTSSARSPRFALYGFPESHAASFALLAYASAYLKAYHPAAFVCALLNNQPMGFYHPFTLVKDAQRHGVRFRPVDVTRSDWHCTLEDGEVRLGLRYVRGLRAEAGERIAAERAAPAVRVAPGLRGPCGAARATSSGRWPRWGRSNAFGLTRRSALWQVEKAGRPRGPLLPRTPRSGSRPPDVAAARHDAAERLGSDLLGTGLTVGPHPLALYREVLRARGVVRAVRPAASRGRPRVRVAGAVICRQRPGTAKGFLFMTLEDETGLVNVTVRPDMFHATTRCSCPRTCWRSTGSCRRATAARCGRSRPGPRWWARWGSARATSIESKGGQGGSRGRA